ncbi:3-oxoacyl-[acyl-carrier-protein] synthase III C-terminal domain-containing protein, partial [Marinitenerispora sediminis]
ALVLSRTPGFARLRGHATVSAPDLEGMHRGDDPFGRAPFETRPTVDLDTCKKAFTRRTDIMRAISRVTTNQHLVVERALTAADTTLADIDTFALPHLGRRRLEAGYLSKFGIDPHDTTWPWSRTIGHLGAGDPFAGLDHLAATGRLTPGTLCLLTSVGAGFTWSAAVIEITTTPPWT